MGKQIDPAFLGNVVILAHKGFTVPNIANALDTTYSRVRGAMEVYGISVNKSHPPLKQLTEEINKLLGEGNPPCAVVKQLTERHKMNADVLYRIMRRGCD